MGRGADGAAEQALDPAKRKKARAKLNSGDRERGAGDHTEAGERLQNAAEIALKTLIMANGEQHEHTHDIFKLWTQAGNGATRPRDSG